MGKRGRQRAKEDKLSAPTTDYTSPSGDVLTLRGSLSPATRREYATLMAGGTSASQTREDIWQRGVEFLFERLAVRWVISDVATDRQKDLLMRFRVASREERSWIRDVMRSHLAEWFPDVEAP